MRNKQNAPRHFSSRLTRGSETVMGTSDQARTSARYWTSVDQSRLFQVMSPAPKQAPGLHFMTELSERVWMG